MQIGSAIGSSIGQFFKLNDRRVINLVASGAAGGIAATFNAPIAGVFFALEIILQEFGMQTFSTIVISAVTASVVSRAALGDVPAFAVPVYSLVSPWELVLYLGLGIVCSLGALAFVKTLHFAGQETASFPWAKSILTSSGNASPVHPKGEGEGT